MTSISDKLKWGKDPPWRRRQDQCRLIDPAHPLLRGETLAAHLRLPGNRGLFGYIMVVPRRETQSEELSHTNRGRTLRFQPWRRVQRAVTVEGFVCDCVMCDSQNVPTVGPVPNISTMVQSFCEQGISHWGTIQKNPSSMSTLSRVSLKTHLASFRFGLPPTLSQHFPAVKTGFLENVSQSVSKVVIGSKV